MARTAQAGLQYFPFDVDFFNDDKIELISSEFGAKGEIIAIRLLCQVYRNGYFYQWGEDESLLFAKRVGNGVTGALVNEVVIGLVRRSFFDKGVFDRLKILTSKGIQSRYLEAKKRSESVSILADLALIPINATLIDNTATLINNNDALIPQSKGEKRKEKESRLKFTPPILSDVISYFSENGYTETAATKAFNYYDSADWKDGTGKQVRNWKQKMQGVWFRDEAKIPGTTKSKPVF